ncbi:hypothetical protein G7046_g4976 [Stylonectria norvegica]|nr:hypothetical protein G7046_g4976 [Stylonectria norvegica]
MRGLFVQALGAALVGSATASPSNVQSFGTTEVGLVRKDLTDSEAFSYSKQNDVLFEIPVSDGAGDQETFTVTCIDCSLGGTVSVDFDNEGVFDFLDSTLNITFAETSAHVDLDIAVDGSGTHAFNIWTSQTPLGSGGDDFSLGLVFYIDLVFQLSSAIDITGGFEYTIPDGSHVSVDLHGDIKGINFDGANSNVIPWKVTAGTTELKVDLRLRAELGASFEVAGIGAAAELGIYLNLLEVIAQLGATDTCALETIEYWDINAGAFANADVILDSTTFGATPTVSTTFYTGSTLSQCWDSLTSSVAPTVVAPIPTPGESDPAPPVPTVPADVSTTADLPPATTAIATEPVDIPTTAPPAVTPTTETAEAEPTTSNSVDIGGPHSIVTSSTFDVGGPHSIVTSSTVDVGGPHSFITSKATTLKPISSHHGHFSNSSITVPQAMHTSTVHSTTVYTVTSCAASVVNCPASWTKEIVVTRTIDLYTTICPVTETQAQHLPTTTAAALPPKKVTITKGVTLYACPTPIVHSFHVPTNAAPPTTQTITVHVHKPAPTGSSPVHKTVTVTKGSPSNLPHDRVTKVATEGSLTTKVITVSAGSLTTEVITIPAGNVPVTAPYEDEALATKVTTLPVSETDVVTVPVGTKATSAPVASEVVVSKARTVPVALDTGAASVPAPSPTVFKPQVPVTPSSVPVVVNAAGMTSASTMVGAVALVMVCMLAL